MVSGRRRELGAKALRTALWDLTRAATLLWAAQETRFGRQSEQAYEHAGEILRDLRLRLDPEEGGE